MEILKNEMGDKEVEFKNYIDLLRNKIEIQNSIKYSISLVLLFIGSIACLYNVFKTTKQTKSQKEKILKSRKKRNLTLSNLRYKRKRNKVMTKFQNDDISNDESDQDVIVSNIVLKSKSQDNIQDLEQDISNSDEEHGNNQEGKVGDPWYQTMATTLGKSTDYF